MSDLVTSIIRTVVPGIVAWLISIGLLPETLSTEAALTLMALMSGVYYAGVRVLEDRWPAAGWLLGKNRPPRY